MINSSTYGIEPIVLFHIAPPPAWADMACVTLAVHLGGVAMSDSGSVKPATHDACPVMPERVRGRNHNGAGGVCHD